MSGGLGTGLGAPGASGPVQDDREDTSSVTPLSARRARHARWFSVLMGRPALAMGRGVREQRGQWRTTTVGHGLREGRSRQSLGPGAVPGHRHQGTGPGLGDREAPSHPARTP